MYSFYHFISVSYGLFNQFRQIISFSERVIKVRIFLGIRKGFPAFPVSGSKLAKKGRAHSPSNRLLLNTNQRPDDYHVWKLSTSLLFTSFKSRISPVSIVNRQSSLSGCQMEKFP